MFWIAMPRFEYTQTLRLGRVALRYDQAPAREKVPASTGDCVL